MANGRGQGDKRRRRKIRAEERHRLVSDVVAVLAGDPGAAGARARTESVWPEVRDEDRERVQRAAHARLTLRDNLRGARDQALLLARAGEAMDVLLEILPQLRTRDPDDPHQAALSRRRAALRGAAGMEPCLSDFERPIPPGPIDALYSALVNARPAIPPGAIDKSAADFETAELAHAETDASLDEISMAVGRSAPWASERRHARKSD